MKSKSKKPVFSIILFVASGIIAVLGTALLVSNVMLYSHNVTQYVAQGYSVDTVTSQLLPSQLIPGVLEPVCVYYGIALLLAAAGIINQKFTKLIAVPVNEEETSETILEPVEETPVSHEHHHTTEVIEDKETIDECISELEEDK